MSFARSVTGRALAATLLTLACSSLPSTPSGGAGGASAGSGGVAAGGSSSAGSGALADGGTAGRNTAGRAGESRGGQAGSSAGTSSGGTSPGGASGGGAAAGRAGSSGSGGSGNAAGGGADGGRAQGGSAGAENGEGGEAGANETGPDRPGWQLVWSDEFEGASGTAVDTDSWNLVNKGDGFGNNELQYYTNRTDNAALDGNGSLVITAKREEHMGRAYTSARLESLGKVELTYGRIESRMKIPFGQGIWPAFWMLGADIGSAGWPACGEIDIMENVGKEPTIVHGTLHGPGYSGENPLGSSYSLPGDARFAEDFHVYAVEWEEDVVRWYVDDELYKTRTPEDVPNGARWVYDHPFYLLLNVAVGGNWPGSPDGTTTFPQTLTVDYVRVYERE